MSIRASLRKNDPIHVEPTLGFGSYRDSDGRLCSGVFEYEHEVYSPELVEEGARLRKLRRSLGLLLNDAMAATDLLASQITNIERGALSVDVEAYEAALRETAVSLGRP